MPSVKEERCSIYCISPDAPIPTAWAETQNPRSGYLGHPPLLCLLVRDDVHFQPLGEVVHSYQEVRISCLSLGRVLLCLWQSSGTISWCCTGALGPSKWFWNLSLLHRCHNVGTTSQSHPQVWPVISLTLSRVLLKQSCPPEGTPWSASSTSFTLLHERTIWAVLILSSAISQGHSSMLSLTTREFH